MAIWRLGFVADLVIQVIVKLEFEDGLMRGVQLVIMSYLKRVCSNLWSKMAEYSGLANTLGPLGIDLAPLIGTRQHQPSYKQKSMVV